MHGVFRRYVRTGGSRSGKTTVFYPICACTVSWGTILPILLSFAARLVANSVFGEYSADAAVIFSPLL
jgi:hypothetical protein